MSLAIAVVAALLAAGPLPATASLQTSAAEPPPSQAAPAVNSLRFSPETLDLGEMISGTPKSGSLTVTNVTKSPITIASIKGACGCTTVSAPPTEPIPAGGSFTVQITVDPGAKTGIDLAKAVHFQIAGVGVQTMTVKGHVKTVVRVSPDVLDASQTPEGADAIVTLESVDKAPFTITGAEPSSFVQLPHGSSAEQRISIDWKKWVEAGRPAKLTLTTDKPDARTLVVPIKAAPAVVLFRMPASVGEGDAKASVEAAQDSVIFAIDEKLSHEGRSTEFRLKIHRETGMLFVHGTDRDVATVRAAVKALPSSAGVRESTN